MGDQTNGPFTAAHRAQKKGFFQTLKKRLTFGVYGDETKAIVENEPLSDSNIMLSKLSGMKDLTIEDVSTPRADIIAIPITLSLDGIIKEFRKSGLSRLPVYQDTLDNPMGMVHLKDLALKHGFNSNAKRFSLKSLLRPVLYMPPSMPVEILMQKMQNERIHMALIIDEYGGVDGLVTIEDLIEQVVGEITDEHDVEEDQLWIREPSGDFLCNARTPLDEFLEKTGIDLTLENDDDDIDTLGGLVSSISGRVPNKHEVIKHPLGYEFVIIDADQRHIKRIRVKLPATDKTSSST